MSVRNNSGESEFIGLSDVTAFLRQYMRTIAACMFIALVCVWFYLATTARVYTAQTQILIEPKISQLLQQQQTEVNLTLDTAQVESQMAVMQSEKIARMVIDELKLDDDPVFNQSQSPSFTDRLVKLATRFGLWGGDGSGEIDPATDNSFEHDRATMWAYSRGLDVRRVGVSYAINISFQSLDPELSAKVANATADAFVREQMETKAASAREGGDWLELRLNELREQMNTATQVAQEFRARHDYGVGPADSPEVAVDAAGKNAPTLEELEVTADTYRKMYESFLQAYTNSVSQQSYPVSDARVITPATRPLSASSPRPKLLAAFALIAGLMAGIGISFLRHTLDRSIRSARQLREEFGLECLGELPPLSGANGGLDEAALSPSSRYSNSLKCVKTAIGLADSAASLRCIGVVSALPSDGKSSFASNLATLYALCGSRTLVIDADVCHSLLSTRLLPAGSAVESDAKAGGKNIMQFIAPAANATFDLLPSAVADARNLLASRNMRALLPELQGYDMVIVDLPPLTCGSDRLTSTPLFDGVIVVAEWGQTPADLFGELIRSLHASKSSIIGVAMTNVRVSSTRMYNGHGNRKPR